jgi:hypothetical protein
MGQAMIEVYLLSEALTGEVTAEKLVADTRTIRAFAWAPIDLFGSTSHVPCCRFSRVRPRTTVSWSDR